jgi:hypothetical protein
VHDLWHLWFGAYLGQSALTRFQKYTSNPLRWIHWELIKVQSNRGIDLRVQVIIQNDCCRYRLEQDMSMN